MEVWQDTEVDALYVKLRETKYAGGKELDDARHMDLDVNGNVIGIEFLYVSQGVDLDGIPAADLETVSAALREHDIRTRSAR